MLLLRWRPMSVGTVSWRRISAKASVILGVCQCLTELSSLLSSYKIMFPWVWVCDGWSLTSHFLLVYHGLGVPCAWWQMNGLSLQLDFTAFTGNLVNTRLLIGGSSFLVGGKDRLEFGRGNVSPHVRSLQDYIFSLGREPQKGKNDPWFELVRVDSWNCRVGWSWLLMWCGG